MILTADHFDGLAEIPLDQLVPAADNPRQDLGDLDGLVASIHAAGIIEPLVVTANGPHGYHVVAGHRRLAAARLAGLATVPCIGRAFKSTAERLEVMAIENLQRADLSPLDEARAMQQLVDLGRTQRDIAERIGCNQSHISRRLSLIELDDDTADKLRRGEVKVREAEQIARPPTVDPILPPAKNLTPPLPNPRPVLERERIHHLAEAMAQPPRVAASGRSLDWAGYRIRLEAVHGDPNVLHVIDILARLLTSESRRWKQSVKIELAPDAAEVQAECEKPANNIRADYTSAERVFDVVQWENPGWLQVTPWPGYRAAKDHALVARIAKATSVDKLRHVIAYEWGANKAPRREAILAAALARLDELSVAVGE